MKAGSCALPYYGIEFAVLDPTTGAELAKSSDETTHGTVEGVLAIKQIWPSIARTIYGDHERYLSVYTKPYPVCRYYSFYFLIVVR